MFRWPRLLMDAICAEEPTAREAALVAAFVVLAPLGWLVLLVRPLRRAVRALKSTPSELASSAHGLRRVVRTSCVCVVVAVAGLALGSCSTATRQPERRDFTASALTPAMPVDSPTVAAAGAPSRRADGASTADANSKFLTLTRSSEPSDLRLGAGDLVEIAVFDVPDLSQ